MGDADLLLRRAAAAMRERAQAATPTPWRLGEHESLGLCEVWGDDDGWNASMVCTTLTRLNPHPRMEAHADAEHIASWHPAVALAVADLLDNEAALIDATEQYPDLHMPLNTARIDLLLDVARAYLGEAGDG